MNRRPAYWWAAFNARPLGMPIPPNWIGLAAFGLLGALLNPGFLLIGGGLELAYLWWLSRNRRFRATVEASAAATPNLDWQGRRAALLDGLERNDRDSQQALEDRCGELVAHLARLEVDSSGSQKANLASLCWLHLRLLAARKAVAAVALAGREANELARKQADLQARLAASDLDEQVRTSLASQLAVIERRITSQREAGVRLEFVNAELERIRQQVELVREQVLLATDAAGIAKSVDVLQATLGEANRWLRDQRELFGGLDSALDEPAPDTFLAPRRNDPTSGVRQ